MATTGAGSRSIPSLRAETPQSAEVFRPHRLCSLPEPVREQPVGTSADGWVAEYGSRQSRPGKVRLVRAVLNVIGFGTEATLDGPRLTRLARDHRGIYWRAEEGLSLKKYFALAFGNIFNFGTSLDPQFSLAAGVMSAPPIDVRVCGETMLTAILGWDNLGATLLLSLVSPGGSTITSFSPGVVRLRVAAGLICVSRFPLRANRMVFGKYRSPGRVGAASFLHPRRQQNTSCPPWWKADQC